MTKKLAIGAIIILAVLGALIFYTSNKKAVLLSKETADVSKPAQKSASSAVTVKSPAQFKSAAEDCRKKIPKGADTATIQSLALACMKEKGFADAHFAKATK